MIQQADIFWQNHKIHCNGGVVVNMDMTYPETEKNGQGIR
jgi:hypothetical protein